MQIPKNILNERWNQPSIIYKMLAFPNGWVWKKPAPFVSWKTPFQEGTSWGRGLPAWAESRLGSTHTELKWMALSHRKRVLEAAGPESCPEHQHRQISSSNVSPSCQTPAETGLIVWLASLHLLAANSNLRTRHHHHQWHHELGNTKNKVYGRFLTKSCPP